MRVLLRLLVFATGLLPAATFAQAPVLDTARVLKNEVGLTASPQLNKFLTANRSLPLGVIYRRHIGAKSALRVRLEGRYGRMVDSTFSPGYPAGNSASDWEVYLLSGYERHSKLGKRWGGYYGVEVGVGGRRKESTIKRDPIANGTSNYITGGNMDTKRLAVQTRFLSGVCYKFTPKVQVFAEAAIQVYHYWEKYSYSGKVEVVGADGKIYVVGGSSASYSVERTQARFALVQIIGLNVGF